MNARKRILIVVVIVVLAATAYAISTRIADEEKAISLTLYGNVDIREVDLAFRVSGRLQSMHFDEGDNVEAGQLLAELDALPYQEALAVARARVAQASAQVDKLRAGTRPQEIARVRAAVTQAQAAYSNAESEFQRISGLLETGASSVKARDAAQARRDAAAAGLDSAREALALAKEGFRSEDIAAAEADLAAARAQQSIV